MNITIAGEAPETVIERLKILLTTPKGTVCYDRAFGLDLSLLDLPLAAARVRYLAECIDLVSRYEPTVKVKDVKMTANQEGQIQIKVVITNAD